MLPSFGFLFLVLKIPRMRETRGVYRDLVGKPEGKRPLGRPMRDWESITFSIREMGWDGMDWIDLAQNKDKW
jgi:hypothetical protein